MSDMNESQRPGHDEQIAVARRVMDKYRAILATLAAYGCGDWKPGDPLIERPVVANPETAPTRPSRR